MKYIFLILLILSACRYFESSAPAPEPIIEKTDGLSWDSRPNGLEWSQFLKSEIDSQLFELLDVSPDALRICSKYPTMNKTQKIHLWSEFFVWLMFYESSWNPKSSSVDVGSKSNKDTWSAGLFQISVTDQWDSDTRLGYSFDDLLDPIKNMRLGIRVMKRQLKRTQRVILDNKDKMRYWAVILDGNKYSKVSEILSKTRSNACN